MSFHSINTVLAALTAKLLTIANGETLSAIGFVNGLSEEAGYDVATIELTGVVRVVNVGDVLVHAGGRVTVLAVNVQDAIFLSVNCTPGLSGNVSLVSPAPMFVTDAVKVFDRKDLIAAFRELFVFEERACFIVPASLRHETKDEGGVRIVRRELELGLLVTDQNFGGENTALIGEAGSNPGVLAIAEAVSDALIGESLGLTGVVVEVELADPFTLSDKEVEETKRAAFAIGIVIPMGELRINLGRRATQR